MLLLTRSFAFGAVAASAGALSERWRDPTGFMHSVFLRIGGGTPGPGPSVLNGE